MTAEVNAAVEGALAGGATLVVVNDAHGPMTNILIEELHPDAQLITGSPKPLSMMQGIEEGFDCAFLVGYHARVGTANAILDHTWTGIVMEVQLNGRPFGELGLNAGLAGACGVPVTLVTGDQAVTEEARSLLGDVEVVAVKQAVGRHAAKCLPPRTAQRLITQAAERAVRGRRDPLVIPPPLTLSVEFARSAHADMAELLPGSRRMGARRVEFRGADWVTTYKAWRAMITLALSVK
jgi:D-amino peptidase